MQELLHFYWVWIFHLPPMISSLLTLKCLSQCIYTLVVPRTSMSSAQTFHIFYIYVYILQMQKEKKMLLIILWSIAHIYSYNTEDLSMSWYVDVTNLAPYACDNFMSFSAPTPSSSNHPMLFPPLFSEHDFWVTARPSHWFYGDGGVVSLADKTSASPLNKLMRSQSCLLSIYCRFLQHP